MIVIALISEFELPSLELPAWRCRRELSAANLAKYCLRVRTHGKRVLAFIGVCSGVCVALAMMH